MNGAEALVQALLEQGVDTCFANPGTSEMHFVAALDRIPGMRCVLGLFEGVVTGAADGYWRMSERPAATLLHLGPGLANGLANLHNAKKARSGIVNVVGEHASTHLALDAPLTSDIAGVAAPMSHWVRSAGGAGDVAALGRAAVAQALDERIACLILPADAAWGEAPAPTPQARATSTPLLSPDAAALDRAVDLLRRDGPSTLLLLGHRALRAEASEWAGRIAAATGCAVMSEFYGARIQRGAGRVPLPRVPYAVDPALAALARFRHIVLVQATPPVAFFAYPGKPGRLQAEGSQCLSLAGLQHDPVQALQALAEGLGAAAMPAAHAAPLSPVDFDATPLDAAGIGAVLATCIPEQAIVVDEGISTGRAFDAATRQAAPHDWLTGMGGSIGFGLPVAVGAAIAQPRRRVLALVGDGSAMYTPQALWTMAREGLDVSVLIFANRAYQILRGEFAGVGAGAPGQRATDMLMLDRPALDWQALGRGHGVPSRQAATREALARALRESFATPGPTLIEAVLG